MIKECKEELVSIIIPVYNTPKRFLEECLESIRKQLYRNIEVVIVDDGSEHETASYLDTLKEKNIVVAHKNRGGSAQLGIMECGVQKETTFALWMQMTLSVKNLCRVCTTV